MSEMLANRYFIARQFEKAYEYYRMNLDEHPGNLKLMKKMVICSIQVGHIDEALDYFYEILKKDPLLIVNTDPYMDDCPCPEIIPAWERKDLQEEEKRRINEILGMLYLYCNLDKSIRCFQACLNELKPDLKVLSILKILQNLQTTPSDSVN